MMGASAVICHFSQLGEEGPGRESSQAEPAIRELTPTSEERVDIVKKASSIVTNLEILAVLHYVRTVFIFQVCI